MIDLFNIQRPVPTTLAVAGNSPKNLKKSTVIPHPDAESARSWHDAEHVEKIHEFSLRVQNGAKNQTDSASGRRMTIAFCHFHVEYVLIYFFILWKKRLRSYFCKKTKHHIINKTFGQYRPIPPTEKTPRSALLEYTSSAALLSR